MQRVFADTSFLAAFLNDADQWHWRAMGWSRSHDEELVTTEYVIVELGSMMSFGHLRALFLDFVEGCRNGDVARIVPASEELLAAGLGLFAARPDKRWGLADCVSFGVMKRMGITESLTFDHHFGQAGFVMLPD